MSGRGSLSLHDKVSGIDSTSEVSYLVHGYEPERGADERRTPDHQEPRGHHRRGRHRRSSAATPPSSRGTCCSRCWTPAAPPPPALLRAVGANPADVRRAAARAVEQPAHARAAPSVAEPSLSREFVNAIGAAEQIARPLGDEYVSTEHLLAGLARVGGAVGPALKAGRRDRGEPGRRVPARCAAATAGSPPPTRSRPTRRWRSTAST